LIKIICSTLLFSVISNADVRVYQYLVFNNNPQLKSENEIIVTSSLNPRAYVAYHGGDRNVSVDLLRTWMCFGHQSKKSLCKSPYSTIPEGVLP